MGRFFRSAIALVTIGLALTTIGASAGTIPLPSASITAASQSISTTPVAIATPRAAATPTAIAAPIAASASSHTAATSAAAPNPSPAARGANGAGTAQRAIPTPFAAQTPAIDHVFYGYPAHAAAAAPAASVTSHATTALASHSIDHYFYGQPPGAPHIATPSTPAAVAAIIAPTPPRAGTGVAIPATAASATPALVGHSSELPADGLHLYLEDSESARLDPFNWSITATKSRHQISVFYRGHLYQTYHAVFGRSRFAGPKQYEGDRRTPEGNYLIVSKHRSARFRWFLKINYPNAADQANFLHMESDGDIPRGLREGGSVGIHGTDLPILNVGNIDWTTGCISIDNEDISELARLLPIGTLVVIKP